MRPLYFTTQRLRYTVAQNLRKYFSDLGGDATFGVGDVTCRDDLVKTLEGIISILRFAAETGTVQLMYEIKCYTDAEVRGTGLLLDFLQIKICPWKNWW